jgi:hypothetical protein
VTTPAGTSATVAADQYSYIYPFSCFLVPVSGPPTENMVHAGQAIPIQFSLGGNYGLGILAASSQHPAGELRWRGTAGGGRARRPRGAF